MRELIALLRAAGLDPSAGELADALWLAGQTARGPAGGRPEEEPGTAAGAAAAESAAGTVIPAPRPEGEEGEEGHGAPRAGESVEEAEDPVRLYVPGARPAADAEAEAEILVEGGVPVRVPGAAALPRILEIQRALRALQRHRPAAPPTRTVLDEPATAEASARALGLVIPVFRPESRREATVRLVMDASPSMAVWQDMFEELRSVCERLGAFRDVQVSYLHRLADGTAVVGRGPVPGAGPGAGLRSGDQLRDPTGRALTMVVSDCAGPVWREGEAQRLLYRWAECTPCVVVQPLPQRLWSRSWLPTERGTLSRVDGGGGKLRFTSERPPRPGRPTGGLTVPVLPPNAIAMGAWARLVAGLGTGPVPAEVGRVLADHPAAPVPPPRAVRPPRELVRRFRSSAAPRAVQLAVYLSAAPLTLPVMRLVQRTMLPDSEPSDLAEVLLSGLLRRGPDPGWYEFAPGVQEVLLGPLGRDEAALVLKHCSEYVLAHFGRGVRNFPALAVSQLTGAPVAEEPGPLTEVRLPQAFAQVSAQVVRRYLPGPPEEDAAAPPQPAPPAREWAVRTARARLADGDQRGLYEAVTVLRRAVTAPPGPGDPPGEAEFELAEALLRLWGVQRDPGLLAEAERAARAATGLPGRLALGRVLYERARVPVEPDAGLLEAAEREFAAVSASPGAGRALRLDSAVRRTETLIRLSDLRSDPSPLREARSALEALASRNAPALHLDPSLDPGVGPGVDPGVGPTRGPARGPASGRDSASGPGRGSAPGRGRDSASGPGRDPASGGRDSGSGPGRDPGLDPGREPASGRGGGSAVAPGLDLVADPAADSALHLALGRVLLALLAYTAGPGGRTDLARLAAVHLAWALGGLEGGEGLTALGTPVPGGLLPFPDAGHRRARVRVELATALRHLPGRLEEAAGQLAAALEEADGDPELRVAGLVCLARVHRERHARDADPVALEDAAEAYGRARRLIPRDGDAYGELLPEWGDVLLARARAADGRRFTSTAVRVLRESRAAVPQSDPRAAHRLRRLAAGLRLRHAYEGDLVDLREAEYLLELAVRHSRCPLEQARAWREHGDVQQEIHAHTHAADRLDRAADSYRRAWRAALEADAEHNDDPDGTRRPPEGRYGTQRDGQYGAGQYGGEAGPGRGMERDGRSGAEGDGRSGTARGGERGAERGGRDGADRGGRSGTELDSEHGTEGGRQSGTERGGEYAPEAVGRREEGPDSAVRLAARVQQLRGEVLERLARPRAALDAYRSALELWQRLGGDPPAPLRDRIRELEATL
ncbi:SAV_2336 N-terminal domain-related protein [Streptomyces sp. ISL-86]|uniref:SAV_2336 N-terminal domain-related protein n=1 Tax=Streptomyces sp. ISL-86 TaxID=2819187 RepID=UPI001BE7A0E1|nr:SAV_2336 N-terminal domain-related protein [Streptomyces sp. ISL-86]MBT2453827.1 hypothetical protein [Streptomyces sp. ISL-86]